MRGGAASAVSQNALATSIAADEGRVEDPVDGALAIAGYTRHGLWARVQQCLYGRQTIFASNHGRALPEVSR
jgi:hypothetical protein